ncbi:hypothetical protein BDV29DRAFT_176191 [Aspergillus leporis]|uniref:Uncharacterized protein n=1 Tax=Aspergillus leporis TaxID=41062 RepID=A0A5N5WWW0_9EURO|nr:hypothetical protein BDV29DRAFT_176191 [Aspergillus leporis]
MQSRIFQPSELVLYWVCFVLFCMCLSSNLPFSSNFCHLHMMEAMKLSPGHNAGAYLTVCMCLPRCYWRRTVLKSVGG